MNLKKIFLLNLVVFLSVFSYSQNTVLLNWISSDDHGTKVETFENFLDDIGPVDGLYRKYSISGILLLFFGFMIMCVPLCLRGAHQIISEIYF